MKDTKHKQLEYGNLDDEYLWILRFFEVEVEVDGASAPLVFCFLADREGDDFKEFSLFSPLSLLSVEIKCSDDNSWDEWVSIGSLIFGWFEFWFYKKYSSMGRQHTVQFHHLEMKKTQLHVKCKCMWIWDGISCEHEMGSAAGFAFLSVYEKFNSTQFRYICKRRGDDSWGP